MFVCIPKFIFRSSVANSKLYFCFTSKNFLNWTESIFCGLSIRQRRLSPFPHRVLHIQWRYWTIESRTFDGGTEWNFSQIPLEPYGYLSNLTLSFWTCWILEPNANYYAGSDEIFLNLEKLHPVTLDSNRIPLGTLAIEPPTLLENYYFLLLLLYKFIH